MVASNGGKARYTYAQRVLGAYSDLQRSHKKHAVHIASLRKQVKRSADEKGDPLGPQWKNWVGRAVRTLEDQGALTPTTPKGSVTLTPEAKKVIDHTRDRHKFRGETSPKQSDILWREVSQQFSGQGIKRKKHQTATGGDDDSNDEEEVLGTLRGSAHMSPNKKSRKTPKSLARMTKAELQAEARRLQLAMGDFQRVGHGNDHRTSADPTDFKMQLQAREIELEKLASELDEVKNALANEHDKYMSVVRTPIGQTVVSQEAATRTPQDAASLRVRPAGGLTRTVSGSYISNVSKHPTPAPSDGDPGSPGFTGDEMTGGMDISSGVFGRVSPPPGETSAEHQLLDIERIEELTKERDDLRNEMQAKLLELEVDLASRTAECHDLQSVIKTQEDEKKALEVTLKSQAEQLEEFQSLVGKLESAVALKDQCLLEHLETQELLGDGDKQLKGRDITVKNLEKTVHDLTIHLKASSEQHAQSQNTISSLEDDVRRLRHEIRVSKDEFEALSTHLADSAVTVGRLETEMASIKEDLSGSGEKVERALADKETAERAADSLHEVIKNCEANISSLSRDVEREQSERSNMAVKLSTALRARSTLKVEVVGKDNDIRRLQDELKTVRESERSLHATLRDVVAQNSAEADRASEREVANVKVEQQLRDTRKELEAMRSKVQEMEASLKNNEEARREATAALAQLEIKLSAVQSQCENMAVDLSSAIKRAQNAEELGESLQETRKLDAEVLRCLKTMYAKMRDAQKEHLREMDEKVLSAELTPVPVQNAQLQRKGTVVSMV